MMRYLLITIVIFAGCNENGLKSRAPGVKDKSIGALTNATNAIDDSANYTSLQWIDSTHQELGQVQQGQVVEVIWRFINDGNKPLIVTNVSASCGCTVAEKPEEPVAPGGEGTIKAKFDSKGREGTQRKDLYVTTNTKSSTNHQLSFSVNILTK
ncbi:MAG: DUF1573 domain-containing protein [Chitinophagaceae bacterium]